MNHPVHIAFCVNDKYVPYVMVTIRSIADCHKDTQVTVHILSDNISDKLKDMVEEEFDAFPYLEIIFHDVDDSILSGLKAWSKYTWYRLLLPTALPDDVSRVLYLDADTLVCADLSPLFEMPMDGVAVAGVIDPMTYDDSTYARCGYPREYGYLCAGVLMVNLDYWRATSLQRRMVDWGLENVDIKYHDQDCINRLCHDCMLSLPLKYGVIDALFTRDALYTPDMLDQIHEAVDSPAIIHFAGKAPWLYDAAIHPMNHLWHECNARLHRRAPRSFKTKGVDLLKVLAYRLLHPSYENREITIHQIKDKLIKAKEVQ